MPNNKEPKLCGDCPLTWALKQEALKRIRSRQLIKTNEKPSALKICIERREIMKGYGLSCPYFNYGFYFGKSTGFIDEE